MRNLFVIGKLFIYLFKPLAFEITGVMGKGMNEHVKQMLRKYLGRFTEGSLVPTLQQGDEDHK